jgi:Glycosyl hydrolase family 12
MTPLTRRIPITRALALPAGLALAGGLLAVSLPAVSSEASTNPTLCQQQTAHIDSSDYTVENNEWGSSEPECSTPEGSTGFAVQNSSIANSTDGAPGGYTAIYKGCHWGQCTRDSGLPIKVADITPGKVTTTWNTAQPGGSNDYDVAYDIWFNQTATTDGQPNGTELMIWLNHNGAVQPFGAKSASNVSIGGRSYDVWYGNQGWNTVSYTMNTGTTSVNNLDLQPLIADAISRGWISPSWYLIDVEAGFEIWHGGQGLATKSFSVDVAGTHSPSSADMAQANPSSSASASSSPSASSSATPSSSPSASSSATPSSSPSASSSAAPSSSASPLSPSATPSASASPLSPSSAPSSSASPLSPSSPASISLQGISPNPSATGTSTNVTVDFSNNGMAVASNVTLITKLRNSAGTVVSRDAETGQNLPPGTTVNVSDAWTPSSAGTYTIEGVVRDSSGKTLERAQLGTVKVN